MRARDARHLVIYALGADVEWLRCIDQIADLAQEGCRCRAIGLLAGGALTSEPLPQEVRDAEAAGFGAAFTEASANVETAAIAADQLSHSIAEISRQLSHTSKVVGQATEEARITELAAKLRDTALGNLQPGMWRIVLGAELHDQLDQHRHFVFGQVR